MLRMIFYNESHCDALYLDDESNGKKENSTNIIFFLYSLFNTCFIIRSLDKVHTRLIKLKLPSSDPL